MRRSPEARRKSELGKIHLAKKQLGPNCAHLGGVWIVHHPTPLGPERVMVAVIDGCQVQWTVKGH